MIEVLDRYVNQTHATGFSTGYAGNQLAMQERLNFAMIISLFAASDRKDRILSQRSRLRPHTLGRLLNLLQNVMHPENTVALLQLATPPDELDPAQVMLIRWGDSVSWSWETWDDHRVADAESIVFLTSTWLLHSAHPFLSDGREPESDSTSVSTASGIAILRVLHHVVLALLPSASPSSTSMTVISRACFNAAESMRHLLSRQKEDERWMLSGFCKYLLSLFVLVVVETDEWLCVTDYILEALSQVDADTLRACLMHIQGDSNLRFSARLDERLTHVKKCVTIILAQDPHTQIWKLNFVRSALNFAVILWFSQTRGCLLRQSVSPFLSTIIEFLLLESSPSLPSKILGDAIFTASAAARKDPFWTDDNQESLWQFAINSPLSNIGIASSFAHYIIASEGPCNSLYCAEAWRYLGEILLLILERQYIEEQEPLALLTCPTVCVGLMRLLQADAAATQFMVSTPLTLNLCAGLKAVCESTRSEQYFTVLKEKLGVVGPCLLDQILLKSRGEAPKIFEDVPMRLIFYRMYGVSHLVFVSDI
ncbi:hypothetical protein B0H11DRAFT_837271 [Mycena galericulata]|nr:hypothetical protein B0H11DRAFT_837271 [Mycena galericulata]